MRTSLRLAATLAVTGGCAAYVIWKIDVHRTVHVLAHADISYFFGAGAILVAAFAPLAWRWQRLLAARRVDEGLWWLIRTSFASYAAGQILPTSLGGDAARIFAGTRRHPRRAGVIAGSVLLERALGGAATLTLAAAGFVLAVGRYDVGPYLWIEGAFIVATAVAGLLLFSRAARRPLARSVPVLRKLRLERPLRTAYEGIHGYRDHPRLLAGSFALTLAVQAVRVAAIWFVAKAVGVGLPLRPYYVMGPMLFLVMLVPFTVNGVAVREAFFVNFLGRLGVGADKAAATGFLFFVLSVVISAPGALFLTVDGVRTARERRGQGNTPRHPNSQ